MKIVYLSMGCFWQSEKIFNGLNGIINTEVGYHNVGNYEPSCSDVFDPKKQHREVVKLIYNEEIINELKIFDIFKKNNVIYAKENYPVPNVYKSGIYIEDKKSFLAFQEILIKEEEKQPIITELAYIKNYKKADVHHQGYYINK